MSPILISPHNSEVVYHAANVLLRSTNRGDTWTEMSPDLTKNLPDRRGGSGNIQYATITTIDEAERTRRSVLTPDDAVLLVVTGLESLREQAAGLPVDFHVNVPAAELAANRMAVAARADLLAVGRASAQVERTSSLSVEVVLAQLRSLTADLLMLTGMDALESTDALPPPL